MARMCVHAGDKIEIVDCQFWVDEIGTLHVETRFGCSAEYDMDNWKVVHPLYDKVRGCPNSPRGKICTGNTDDVPPTLG